MPRMFSASYQRYSSRGGRAERWGDPAKERYGEAEIPTRTSATNNLTVRTSRSHLPVLDRPHRSNQHNYLQQQAVSDPNKQQDFDREKNHDRFPPAEFPGDDESNCTTEDVPE